MALRAVVRLRRICGWQLRILAHTPQHARKASVCSFSADASTNEVRLTEEKVEGFTILSQDKVENAAVLSEEKVESSAMFSDNTSEERMEGAAEQEFNKETPFKASIQVGAPYIRFIVGRGGITRANIQKSTNTLLLVPPAREVRSNVSLVVKGASQESVDEALVKIKAALEGAERNPNLQYTHFVSLPLSSHQGLVEQLRSFKSSILNDEQNAKNYVSWFPQSAQNESASAVPVDTIEKVSKSKSTRVLDPDLEDFFSEEESSDDEEEHYQRSKVTSSFFIKPETVHITVLMLKLFSDERVKLAAEVLEEVQPRVLEILDGKAPKVSLRGLDCFRGTPAEARVLAIKVLEHDDEKHLQQACYAIKDGYAEAGLLAAADMKQDLMLHATLMNTSLGRRLRSKPFDARKMLAKYRLHNWGDYTIDEVHLSQRFFYDKGGYYRCCGSFGLTTVTEVSA